MAEKGKNKAGDQSATVTETISPPENKQSDDVDIPADFYCPLSGLVMTDPLILSNGETYEGYRIEDWLNLGNNKIDPVSRELLPTPINPTPNNILRRLILNWCQTHDKGHHLQYSFRTPPFIRQEYFNSLHKKLSSGKLEDQKQAANYIRRETTRCPYFRKQYADSPDSIELLISALVLFSKDPHADEQVVEDLISTLMSLSFNEAPKKVIGDSVTGIMALAKALQSDNQVTQHNAVLTVYEIASLDSSKKLIATTDVILDLGKILCGNRCKILLDNVAKTLLRLFENAEIAVKAVKQFADAGFFKKIEDSDCVVAMISVLLRLSTFDKGMEEILKCDCRTLLLVLRGSAFAQDKQTGTELLYNALKKDIHPWQREVYEEDLIHGTIKEISLNGTPEARKTASAILNDFTSDDPKV